MSLADIDKMVAGLGGIGDDDDDDDDLEEGDLEEDDDLLRELQVGVVMITVYSKGPKITCARCCVSLARSS